MSRSRGTRGLTLLEVLVASAIIAAVLAVVVGIMVNSTRSFAREQGQTYTQFRVRTSLDDLVKDIRMATEVAPSTGLPTNTGAITLKVPCQGAGGILYSASPPSAENMVKDTVAYYVKDGVLSRKTTVGDINSTRETGTVVVANDVSSLSFTMRTASGSVTTDVAQAAEIDVSATVGDSVGAGPKTVALTAVRMRNTRAAST